MRTAIWPECASTMPRAMDRPRPPPCWGPGVRALSPRNATSKTRGRSSGGIPPQASATLTQAEVNRLLAQGYKPQKGRGDNVLYCRSEAPLGSRLEKKVCLSADQIKAVQQDKVISGRPQVIRIEKN